MLSVLDDQCKFPKATDEAFSHKLRETLSGHSHFGVTPRAPGDFIVLHYAGPVQYSSTGFLDKNKDTLNAGEAGGEEGYNNGCGRNRGRAQPLHTVMWVTGDGGCMHGWDTCMGEPVRYIGLACT